VIPAGSLSQTAINLRKLLVDGIDEFNDISRVTIGHPAKILDGHGHGNNSSENQLNLFFYHVEYSGYPADVVSENPFYVRIYCLITAVGDTSTPDTISRGENELRLIGEVMRVFHQNPFIAIAGGEGTEIAELQIIPHALSLDSLNHIWSTQGSETPYRLSVAYEMSLAPVPLAVPVETSPRVGDPRMHSWGAMHRDKGKENDGLISLLPVCEYTEIDIGAEDWAPHIAYVENSGQPAASLHYVHKLNASSVSRLHILIAGKEGAEISLFWSFWLRKKDKTVQAWSADIPATPPSKTISNDSSGDPFYPNRIDPASIDARRIVPLALPAGVGAPDVKTWQATLYATREWSHEVPPGSGNNVNTKIQSNLILFYGDSGS